MQITLGQQYNVGEKFMYVTVPVLTPWGVRNMTHVSGRAGLDADAAFKAFVPCYQ